jgi:hypothetical protein
VSTERIDLQLAAKVSIVFFQSWRTILLPIEKHPYWT